MDIEILCDTINQCGSFFRDVHGLVNSGRVFILVLAGETLETTIGLATDGVRTPKGKQKEIKNTFMQKNTPIKHLTQKNANIK